jgi:hypothetical protein
MGCMFKKMYAPMRDGMPFGLIYNKLSNAEAWVAESKKRERKRHKWEIKELEVLDLSDENE